MKKLILLFVSFLFCCSPVKAQHYRGFADLNLSIPTVMDDGNISYSDAQGFAMGLITSHGVQLKKFFIGAGIGVFYNFGCGDCYPTPLFINGRYDFFNIYKANLFIDCKLGYLANYSGEVYLDTSNDEYFETEFKGKKLFFNPSIGVRLRCSNICGINISIGYLPVKMTFTKIIYNNIISDTYTGRSVTDHRISLTIGIDF